MLTTVPSLQSAAQPVIALIPIDDRPATTQFAEMIAAIAGRRVLMPHFDYLGRFTTPGNAHAIAGWLQSLKASDAEALVVSADMLAYGGLVASRKPGANLREALGRLDSIRFFRKNNHDVPVLAFSTVMRLAPTATAASASYHDALARYASIVDEAEQTRNHQLANEAARLKAQIPAGALDEYLATRQRNHSLNLRMLHLVQEGVVDFLILSQDDAKHYGLHRSEQRALEVEIERLKIGHRALLYAGADEVSNVLISRAVLQKLKLQPAIDVVYSSTAGKRAIDPYEDRPLEESVRMQILASGAKQAAGKNPDYTLFLHVPKTTPEEKGRFFQRILDTLGAGKPAALGDVVWVPIHGGPDPQLIKFLTERHSAHLLRAFASWNTAGNTLGTVIPQANMDVVLRQFLSGSQPDIAEAGLRANLEFLLHRYVNDWGYHDKVRMPVYDFIRRELKGTPVELNAEQLQPAEAMVREEMIRIIRSFFAANFEGMRLPIPGTAKRYLRIDALEDLQVRLPWPRPFEVEIRFRMRTSILNATDRINGNAHAWLCQVQLLPFAPGSSCQRIPRCSNSTPR